MTHKLTRLLALMLAVIMAFSMLLVPVQAASFTDVKDGAWYEAAVEYVTERGWMAGVSESSFAPNTDVTRGMMVTVLARIADVKTDNDTAAFADTAAGKWYTGAAAWAAENGIVAGVGNGKFAPNRAITRQDLCLMLYGYLNAMGIELKDTNIDRTFSDMDSVASYAREAVIYCLSRGLISGFEDGSFRPKNTATRAQLAQILMRLDLLIKGEEAPTDPMPAQSFDGEAGEDMSVSVNAPEGALPENTNMTVSRVTDEAALAAIAEKINGRVYAAADISFSKDGTELEPEKAVEVQISLDGLENLKNPTVYHVNADGSVERVSSELVSVNRDGSVKALRFYANSFSVYIIGEGSTTPLLTVEFRNKDNTIISLQALRISTLNNDAYVTGGKDYIYDPGVPAITATQSFEGWADKQNYSETDHGYSVEEINKLIKDNRQTYIDGNQDVTLTYYAKVYDVRYVVYHDQAGAVLMTQSYHIHEGNDVETVEINWPYVGFKGEQNFAGWVKEDKVDVAGDYPLYKDSLNTAEAPTGDVYKNGTTYSLNDTLQLYPYLNTGHWLVFDTYKDQDADSTSTSYIGPVFYEEGKNTVAPTKPTRTGYEFKGWYKDKQFTNRFIFGSPISEDTTIYAKWEAQGTTYHVVFWTQKITDTPTTLDADKEYDFFDSVLRTATTGDTVSIQTATSGTTADNRLGYNENGDDGRLGYYFLYNGTNTDTDSKTVKGDGSTTLNVYYDRKVITYNFYTDSSLSTLWTPTGGYVEAENGDYYYYNEMFETGYYLIGWPDGPLPSYQPVIGDTVYYYDSYNASSASSYPLPSYSDVTKYSATLVTTYGGSHTMSDSNDYVYYTANEDTWIWNAGSSASYPYRPLYYKYTAQESGYYPVGTGPDPDAAGTHNLSGGVGSNPISGIYGAQLTANEWPKSGSGYVWSCNVGSDVYDYPLGVTEFVPVLAEGEADKVEMNYYLKSDSGAIMKIFYVGQDLDGEDYSTVLLSGNNTVDSNGGNWYPNETILGYTVYGYRWSNLSDTWTECTTATAISLPTSATQISTRGDLYIAFKRNTHKFSFYSNNQEVTPDNIPAGTDLEAVPYGTELSAFMSAEPTNGPEGTYFDGWYADPAFDTPFDFNTSMPDNNIRIYAKWTVMRFRVVLDPTGGESGVNPSDITFPGNQATTFRVDYGELVQASSINNAQREGHTLLGWFLDKDYKTPFNFGNPVTDAIADMTYADADDADRRGSDPWNIDSDTNLPKTYDDADGAHDDVVGKVTIYAHWREDPDGVIGINVDYLANDKNNKTGKFSDNSTEWEDPNIYADQAMAFGQPASTPDDNTLQFLYWEILDKDGSTVVGKAYPGQLWKVDFKYAKEVTLNSGTAGGESTEDGLYTFEQYLSGVTAQDALQAEPQSEPTRAANTYKKVTTLTEGKQYLITYTSGSTAYIVGNSYYDTSYNDSPLGVRATVSSNTITGDYDQYLFGVDINSNGQYQFGSLNRLAYLGTRGTTRYVNFGSNNEYWEITSQGYLHNVEKDNTISNSHEYLEYYSNYNYFRGNSSGQVITFYELQEPEVTGETFDVTTELAVGNTYIIAIGDYAVGNQPLNSSSNDHFIKGVRGKANTSSFTLPAADVDTATWEIVSGDATNGFVFKNKGNGTYLGMSSDGQCYLAATTESLASHWTYDNGTELNNHVEEENNASGSTFFYYLSFAGSFLDFTTATYTGQNVKLYAASKSYTVTFKDGYTNTVIATQTVQEGEAANAPDAPDHSDVGMIFSGWDTDYSNVTADITVTAQYVDKSTLSYTVTFRYMNSSGEWVSESQTVQHGQAATEPNIPTPPTGYTFNSWDKKFNNITSNLTINAVYKQVATKKYTITLRAVYGLKTTEALTHINWYANNGGTANNGAGDCYAQTRVEINAPVAIPTPTTWTAGTWEYNTSSTGLPNPTGLSWPGHTFLGWARVDSITGSDQKAHPELATEADCWLIWHEDASVSGGGYYTVNLEKDTEYAAAGGSADTHQTNVGADEMRPYHDMYAVWSSHVFYVYHSSNGKLQAFDLPISTAGSGSMIGTFNITKLVEPGYLYGGYYSTYGGVNMTELQKQTLSVGSTGWTAGTLISPNWNEIAELNTADITAVNFDKYDGSSLKSTKNNNARFWTKADAYNVDALPEGMTVADVNGETMKPKADTIYYLKEVPDTYLHSKYAFVYTTDGVTVPNPEPGTDGALKLDQFYYLTAVDDTAYKSVGFRTGNDYTAAAALTSWENSATLTPKFTIIQKECAALNIPARTVTITPTSFTGLTRGYVGVLRDDSVVATAGTRTMLPSWLTLDGVVVGSTAPLKITIETNNVTSTNATVPAAPKMLYVNVNAIEWWTNDGAETRVKFSNNQSDPNAGVQVETTQVGTSKYYCCAVPDGYQYVRLQRYVNGTFQNESVWIDLNENRNCIETYWPQENNNPANGGVTWKTYIP